MKNKRASGVLLHISSLPSHYGIGTLGKEAYRFVDFLNTAGQTYWQILPLGPTGYGDSPYQVISSFAGNPYFIDIEMLLEDGLLKKSDLEGLDFGSDNPGEVNYYRLFMKRKAVIEKAFRKGIEVYSEDFSQFKLLNSHWLEDYALYMTLKYEFEQKPYYQWEEKFLSRETSAIQVFKHEFFEEIEFWSFVQYLFYDQWSKLKRYANERGINLIGDIPIYVGRDSMDVWANPKVFCLNEDHSPKLVSGVPPDAFSAEGQLWGNPVYDWEYLRNTDYSWWVARLSHCMGIYDSLRIDHFRGFESYWAVPYGNDTAEDGVWIEGPGIDFFKKVESELGKLDIIAEDLGFLTPAVYKLKEDAGYMGMKILQFAFDGNPDNPYLPYNFEKISAVYPGTHDNDTLSGWLSKQDESSLERIAEYLGVKGEADLTWEIIKLAYASVSKLCIVQFQDLLKLGSEARMNTPSTTTGNWTWRMKHEDMDESLARKLADLSRIYGRR